MDGGPKAPGLLATGRRFGDSRHETAPAISFTHESRPRVGTSRTYQGKETTYRNSGETLREMNSENKIAGLSPGPMYPAHNPKPGSRAPGPGAPAYSFGATRTEIDKRDSPGPANYNKATAPNLGRQRVDSTRRSLPVFGMGSGTRETRELTHVAKGRLFSNNLPSRYLLGGSIDPMPDASPPAPPAAQQEPARKHMGRALLVAMAAAEDAADGSDPTLTAALTSLRNRVATLDASRGKTKQF